MVDQELKDALHHLKHSIKVDLSIAGEITQELGPSLLKLVDILESDDKILELNELSFVIIMNLYKNVRHRIELLVKERPEVKTSLESLDLIEKEDSTSHPLLERKEMYLKALATAFRFLSAHTGHCYPEVRNEVGAIL